MECRRCSGLRRKKKKGRRVLSLAFGIGSQAKLKTGLITANGLS
jgi:hypothetical protein